MNQLRLTALLPGKTRPTAIHADVRDLIIAGWTGRDPAAVQDHIDELRLIGVAPPPSTPMFYRVGAGLLTVQQEIDVVGDGATGEVEFLLLKIGRALYIGLGSDQTDRRVETIGVTLSKQVCPKPVGTELWRWTDVESHWDELVLSCTAYVGGRKIRYQEGRVTSLLHPMDLLQRLRTSGGRLLDGTAMFCGTLPAKNRITWADRYLLELEDPILKRSLRHTYSVRVLPVAG